MKIVKCDINSLKDDPYLKTASFVIAGRRVIIENDQDHKEAFETIELINRLENIIITKYLLIYGCDARRISFCAEQIEKEHNELIEIHFPLTENQE